MSIRVTELDENTTGLWDAYVAGHPESTLFHTLIWRDAVTEAFGHASRYLMAWRDDRVVGVFPADARGQPAGRHAAGQRALRASTAGRWPTTTKPTAPCWTGR